MKKLMIFLGLIALFSCENQPCKQCMTVYNPVIHPPETFSVCSDEEFDYWNGRESIMTDELGNTFQLITTCE